MSYQGLQKQSIDLRLGGGIDESAHDFVGDLPTLAACNNARFGDRGAVGKRYGSSLYSTTGKPGSSVEAQGIYEHEGTLSVWHPDGWYKLDSDQATWDVTNECAPRPSKVRTDALVRGSRSWSRCDSAIIDDVMCVVWEDALESEVYYAFYSTSNLSCLSGPTLYPTASNIRRRPRVIALGTRFVLFGLSGTSGIGDVYIAPYVVSAGTYQFGASVLTVATGDFYDVAVKSSTEYVLLTRSGASDTRFSLGTHTGVSGSVVAATFHGYAVCVNGTSNRFVAVGQVPAGAWGALAHVDWNLLGAATVVAPVYTATPNTSFARATIVTKGSAGDMVFALSGIGSGRSASADQCCTDIVEITNVYALTRSGRVPTACLVGKAINIYDAHTAYSDVLIPLGDQVGVGQYANSTVTLPYQAAPYGFLARPQVNAAGEYDIAIVARFLQDKLDKSRDSYHLGSLSIASPDGVPELWSVMPVLIDAQPQASRTNFERKSIDLVRARIDKAPPARSVTAQSLRLLGSGAGVLAFDGTQLVENSPPQMTCVFKHTDTLNEDLIVDLPAGGSGSVVFRLRFVHRWTDAQGNIHRGAPSGELHVDAITAKNADRAGRMEVEVYQAEYPSGDFHLIATCEPYESPTSPALWCVDFRWGASSFPATKSSFYVVAYTQLSQFPAAYFTDENDNNQPPPALDLCSTQNRLWLLNAENRYEVWPSKPIVPGKAPEFSSDFAVPIPHEGGECVGLAALNDKVVVFKRDRVYVLFGDPGDAAGAGSTLQKPRLVSAVPVGCTNVNSIVEFPGGVAFQSDRGFYAIGPDGLSGQWIGEAVKGTLGSLVVTSGTHVPAQSEIRWTLDSTGYSFSSNVALVYNYQVNAWSYWTGYNAVHACTGAGIYIRLLTSSNVRAETVGSWAADATAELSLTTQWIKLGGLQGFKRLWRATFLGRYFTGGFGVECEFDYVEHDDSKPGEWHTHDWTSVEMATISNGVAPEKRLQVAVRPTRQKIESIRFTISEDTAGTQQAPATVGQGFELVGVQLDVGLKRGAFKNLIAGAKK
jgi:hypothetical protein